MINRKFSLVVVSEEEHIGSFKGTKNVLFKIDSSYMGVYFIYSSVCIFHNKKFLRREHLVLLLSFCLVSLLPLPWVNILFISPGPSNSCYQDIFVLSLQS